MTGYLSVTIALFTVLYLRVQPVVWLKFNSFSTSEYQVTQLCVHVTLYVTILNRTYKQDCSYQS